MLNRPLTPDPRPTGPTDAEREPVPVDRGSDDGAAAAPLIELRTVSKSFGETRALVDASLSGRAGEIHAIVGENGSGKSTLIKVLAGIHRADAGEVCWEGEPVAGPSPARMQGLGVAAVFQEVLIAEGASVLDNVFIGYDGLFRKRLSAAGKARRAGKLLERLFGRPVDLRQSVGELSLSEQQLVTVARALVRAPRLLILDESTSALDLRASTAVMTELERLKTEGSCILLVTHRIAELEVLADRATVLRDGATVGRLAKGEFSEGAMLKMMSGREPELGAGGGAAGPAVPFGPPVVSCEEVRIRPESAPFSLRLREGEILGLAGLEGHGQAELIEAVAAIGPLAGGEVRVAIDGQEHAYATPRDAERLGLAYVSGDRKREGIFPDLSILDNFAIPAYRRHARAGFIDWKAVRGLFARYREMLKIRMQRSSRPITALSGGNQQKVILARWLALDPRVLLLNDPTRGVDVGTKHDLYAVLRQLTRGERKAVMLLSTEIEELVEVCDRILVFRNQTLSAELAQDEQIDDVLASMFGAKELDAVLEVEARSVETGRAEGES